MIVDAVVEAIRQLQTKGWTTAAIADELAVHWGTVNGWKMGRRPPQNPTLVLMALEGLLRRQRIPKRRRYGPDAPQRRPRKGPGES